MTKFHELPEQPTYTFMEITDLARRSFHNELAPCVFLFKMFILMLEIVL